MLTKIVILCVYLHLLRPTASSLIFFFFMGGPYLMSGILFFIFASYEPLKVQFWEVYVRDTSSVLSFFTISVILPKTGMFGES